MDKCIYMYMGYLCDMYVYHYYLKHACFLVQPYNLSVEANLGLELPFGENVTLTCTSQGGPTLNYTWMLPDNTNVTSDLLPVNNVMTNDTGEYTCIVTSEAGNASTSVTLSG